MENSVDPPLCNLTHDIKNDAISGRMEHTKVRPQPGHFADLRSEMHLLVALSGRLDFAVGDELVDVSIYNAPT